jgi:hypothetical protein
VPGLAPANQPGGDGAADEAAAHQAEGRRRHRQGQPTRDAVVFLQEFSEGCAGAVAARHRDRPGDQAYERLHTEHRGQRHPYAALHDRQHGGQTPEQEDLRSAHLQQAQAGAESDRREKGDHEGRLQRGVELEGEDAGQAQQQGGKGEQEPAHHRCRDVVAIEHSDSPPDAVSHEEDQRRQRQRLDHVEPQREMRHHSPD